MMRKYFPLLFLFHFQFFSQNFEKGHLIPVDKDKFFNKIIGEDKNGYYSLRYNFKGNVKEYFINQYNKVTLNKIRTIDVGKYLLEEEVNQGVQFVPDFIKVITYMFILKEKIYIFSKLFNPPEKRVQLVADIYSTINGEPLALDSVINNIISWRYDIYERKFHLSLSPDSTKILSVALSSIFDDMQTTTATLYSLDEFKKIWEKELMTTYDDHVIKSRECRVDTGDNLYYSFGSMESSTKPGYHGVGLAYIGKKELKENILSGKLYNSVQLYNPSIEFVREDNAFYFCYNFKDSKRIKNRNSGIIYSKISIKENRVEFTDTIYFSEKNKSILFCDKPSTDIDKYVFAPVKIKIINGFRYLYTYIDSYEMRINRLYHGSNIIAVFGISVNGKQVWQTLLPRSTFFNFVTENKDLTGIQVLIMDNKLNFLFTDNVANETILNNDGSFDYCNITPSGYLAGTSLKLTSIDENGKIIRKTLFTNDKEWILPGLVNIPTNNGAQIIRYKTIAGEGFGKLNFTNSPTK